MDKASVKQHEKGKLSSRERFDQLLDEGTLVESGTFTTVRTKDFGMNTMLKMSIGPVYTVAGKGFCRFS